MLRQIEHYVRLLLLLQVRYSTFRMLERAEIEQAAERIASHVRRTPVIALNPHVVLKLELMQHTGSFKPRGAFNRMLAQPVPLAGVIAASGGNHGAAVAWAARTLGHAAEIFVPGTTPAYKQARLRGYGAHLTLAGNSYAEALAASRERAAQTRALELHAYDQPEIVAGQGTLAREWQAQSPELDTVIVAVGGGGLIAGIAAWYAGRIRVVAVETEGCPTLNRALAAGQPVDVEVSGIAADSLGARRIGGIAFEIAQRYVAHSVLVGDAQLEQARRTLWEDFRVAAEPGGAAALAALLSGAYRPERDEKVGVLICGGNAPPPE